VSLDGRGPFSDCLGPLQHLTPCLSQLKSGVGRNARPGVGSDGIHR
jgi:hypothetical protein